MSACSDRSAATGDARPTSPAANTVRELERLAFVPAGRTSPGSALDVGIEAPLLVDRYEVTVRLWEQLFPNDDPIPTAFRNPGPGDERLYPAAWSRNVPITAVALADAREAAARRGMRLPTFEEWLWCAVGSRSRRVPAGRLQRGLANTVELGLGRSSPVGAFESGQTPDTGIYDLLGNVWEWVEPPMPGLDWVVLDPEVSPRSGGRDASAWVVGGSYAWPARPTFSVDKRLNALAVTPGYRSTATGFRCVVDAAAYLRGVGSISLTGDASLRRRVRAVGRSWGLRATALLTEVESNGVVAALLEGAEG